jgi:hypothetical protein
MYSEALALVMKLSCECLDAPAAETVSLQSRNSVFCNSVWLWWYCWYQSIWLDGQHRRQSTGFQAGTQFLLMLAMYYFEWIKGLPGGG